MRYLVSVDIPHETGNQIEARPGGPGPYFAHIAERFKPEAFYAECGRRRGWWVIEFKDNAAMIEFTLIAITRLGATPCYMPVMTGAEANGVIAAGSKAAALAPK